MFFNNSNVTQRNFQKHLGRMLDSKFSYHEYIEKVFGKVNIIIFILRKLQLVLPRPILLIIYKSFRSPHLEYGDVI